MRSPLIDRVSILVVQAAKRAREQVGALARMQLRVTAMQPAGATRKKHIK